MNWHRNGGTSLAARKRSVHLRSLKRIAIVMGEAVDIQLNFINESNDRSDSQIVIFQKNVAAAPEAETIAWLVIQHCGVGDNHPFTYPMTMQVAGGDSWGNFTPRLNALPGQMYAMSRTSSGDTLYFHGPATVAAEVQVLNALPQGAISANIYRADRLLACKTSIVPKQIAAFEFEPTLWIGVASEAVEGEVIDAAVLSEVNTEISLLGISSADIVMTGGGPGPQSPPFTFSLANVEMA